MLRTFHSLPGLFAALLVIVLAITGAILSVQPVSEQLSAPSIQPGTTNVAALAARVKETHGDIDKIVKTASGSLIVYYFDGDRAGADVVDPATGRTIAPYAPSGFMRTVTNLHRALLMGTAGRIAAGIGALAMLILTISGAMMLAARLGGWKALLRPITGTGLQRLHVVPARLAMVGLLLSGLTGCYMSATTFELIPDGATLKSAPMNEADGGPRMEVGALISLQGVDLAELRELTFPYAGDLTDTYTLTTADHISQIDAATGALLGQQDHPTARRIYEIFYMLHTGQGLWPLALMLGLCALAAPVMAISGALIWWKRRSTMPRIRANASANTADTLILVGSESNSTWGFAQTLHNALTKAGHVVHVAPMNAFRPDGGQVRYGKAARLLILTATYGDGAAPASASHFLARLETCDLRLPVAVLGFGDSHFPQYCRFAEDVAAALAAQHWPHLLELHRIDRQSAQEFARWGEKLGTVLAHELALSHVAAAPRTTTLELIERADYGAQVQAPTTILRFAMPRKPAGSSFWSRLRKASLPAFEAGDIVGILAPGSTIPRYYSLASSQSDGALEICVRKQPGGLCSGYLHGLTLGGTIEAFIRPNPSFRPNQGNTPLILIGAGAGIGPLMGFIRHNRPGRTVHLYWGGRSPASDFLYEEELSASINSQQLTGLHTAFSRITGGGYVQGKLSDNAADIRQLVARGAQILVCGGRDMAGGVREALDTIMQPAGQSLSELKMRGLYVEDVY